MEKNSSPYRSRLVSRNVRINGHRTSIRLEPELWNALEKVCAYEDKTIHELCSFIAAQCEASSFTSAVRVYILTYYERRFLHFMLNQELRPTLREHAFPASV